MGRRDDGRARGARPVGRGRLLRHARAADRWTGDGWFRTGDIVSIHPRGFIQIKDRSKDVIKSGGEWISSVDLENALMAHPAVSEAAVIAIPDDKWAERPLAAVVLKKGQSATADDLREFLAPSFAKWWLPDRFEFVAEIPKTSVGKFRKTALREQFAGAATRARRVESRAPARRRRAVRARRRPRPGGRRGDARPGARCRDQLRRRPRPPRPLPADARAAGGARLGDRRRARGRYARDGDHLRRRRVRGARGGPPGARRAAAGAGELRRRAPRSS